ncbi:cyclic AMP-dependent transcription factor ATF-2-like isoform X2 [Varroa destructor]|uniref:BZIP domain-containing protein n=1 Tax=Varroa destructor TaxID=109461 RepID=A0A7M7KUT2_VARDE|nr:cyclic AMP-dependent transcription factor ATF-2-like isoform X2 [Varroa destructor]
MRMIQKDFEELYGAPLRLDAGSPPDYADRQLYGINFKSSYVGDPHGNDPICAVETATADQTAAHFAPHREVLPAGEGHAAASPLHGPQPVSSRHPPERLAEQVPNHVGIIPLTSPPYHSLQSIQSLPHLHEPYHAPTVATIVSNGDVYSQLNSDTRSGVLTDYPGAAYDASYYENSPYTDMVSPPPITSHSDVKPTEEELWHFRQRKENTQPYVSSCCGPYDSPTQIMMTTNAGGLVAGSDFEPQPSTSHDNTIAPLATPTEDRRESPQGPTKAGRPTRIKREPLCSESSVGRTAPDDLARRLRRRERNKVAAAKCRSKKKRQQEQLTKDHIYTRHQNEALQREVANLKAKVQELRDQLTNHNCCLIGDGQTSIPASVPVSTPPVAPMASAAVSTPTSLGYSTGIGNAAGRNDMLHQHPTQEQMAGRNNFSTQNTNQHHPQQSPQSQQLQPDRQVWPVHDNPWGGSMMG